jgi:hypothetical protein
MIKNTIGTPPLKKLAARLRGTLRFRLDTLTLLISLAAVGISYGRTHYARIQWQERLSRTESAFGLPMIQDIGCAEIARIQPFSDRRLIQNSGTGRADLSRSIPPEMASVIKDRWQIWVPHQQQLVVRYADAANDWQFPTEYEEVKLDHGRHTVAMEWDRRQGTVQFSIDERVLLELVGTRCWNASYVAAEKLESTLRLEGRPVRILRAFGEVREASSVDLQNPPQRSGLMIWVQS